MPKTQPHQVLLATGLTNARASFAMDIAVRSAEALNAPTAALVLDSGGEILCCNRTDGAPASLFVEAMEHAQSLLFSGAQPAQVFGATRSRADSDNDVAVGPISDGAPNPDPEHAPVGVLATAPAAGVAHVGLDPV